MADLANIFSQCRAQHRPAFISFITAGDPTLDATGAFVEALVSAGADIIEIGFPYSDPLADGPVIQASYTRALAAGLKLDQVFTAASGWTQRFPQTPFVAMVSYSLIHRRGVMAFLDACRQAGFAGLIVPDLPHDEGGALLAEASTRQLALIHLVTPTTPPDRAAAIAQTTTGFLYVVSVTGITGARTTVPAELARQLTLLRTLTALPLCVGFGISTPDQARSLRGLADGVIVGSALVRCLEGDDSQEQKRAKLQRTAAQLRDA